MALSLAAATEGGLVADKAVGAVVLHGVGGVIHSPVCVHLWPHTMIWSQYTIVHQIFVNPALHIVTTEWSKCEARLGMM